MSPDRPGYSVGGTIVVTYAGLPGNVDDWIAIASAGAPGTSYLSYVFTGGQTAGTATFATPAAGSYVARAFPKNTYEILAEAGFTVANTATIGTSQPTYGYPGTISVSYAGLPGNVDDWIAIASAGAPGTSYLSYVFTGGQTAGTATLATPAAGSYVARAFPKNTYQILAEAGFTVANTATIGTSQPTYGYPGTISVSYAGLPGNVDDWIAIAPAGAPSTSYLSYVFTGGQTAGTATLATPAAGSYVARAFPKNTYQILAEAGFTVANTATIGTSQPTYGYPGTISVSYAGLPGNVDDWIAIASAAAPSTSYLSYVFTGGQTAGTATLATPAAGSYVARAFPKNTYEILAEAGFTVVNTATVVPGQSSYAPGAPILDQLQRAARQRRRLDHHRPPGRAVHDVPGLYIHQRQRERHRHPPRVCPRQLRRACVRQEHVQPVGRERRHHHPALTG